MIVSTCPAVGMTADAARLEARATKTDSVREQQCGAGYLAGSLLPAG
jgi:hypothetical protein